MKFINKLIRRELQRLLLPANDKELPAFPALHNIRLIELNVKAFGYELARKLGEALPVTAGTTARHVGLATKMSTQADIESDWAAHWSAELKTPVIYHRKLWELAYTLQALHEHGHLREGARGLGFGCGIEPIPSYLASRGVSVTVTDLPPDDRRAQWWSSSSQHLQTLESAFHAHLVDRAVFDARVEQRVADMNAIPADLRGYDFCWSMCAMEHLGSIRQGLDFLEASLATLRSGGLSVHTMEFNIEDDGPTVDNWPTVLFQRKHIEEITRRLEAQGHVVAPLDFDPGDRPMDNFIDVPPYSYDMPEALAKAVGDPMHLKLGIDGFIATCYGIIIRKAG